MSPTETDRPERHSRVGDLRYAEYTHLYPGTAGYVCNADVYCPDCARHMDCDTSPNSPDGVLADSEWDCGSAVCGFCGIALDVNVLCDGVPVEDGGTCMYPNICARYLRAH